MSPNPSLGTIKNMLGITTNKHDTYLIEVIDLFVELAIEECNNPSLDKDGDLPAGVKLYVAKAVEFNMGQSNLKDRSMGDVSYSYITELPRTITKYLNPYKRMRAR